jgi:hypothetical protein
MLNEKTFPCAQCGNSVPVAKLLDGQTHVFCTPGCFRKYKRHFPVSHLAYYHRKAMESYFPNKGSRRPYHMSKGDEKSLWPDNMRADWFDYYNRMSSDSFKIATRKGTVHFDLT